MLEDGSLAPWTSPEGKAMEMAAVIPDASWSALAQTLVPNGSSLDYVKDSPYLGESGRFGVLKYRWVQTLRNLAGSSGFYPPSNPADPNFDPAANLDGWKAMLDAGGPYEGPSASAANQALSQTINTVFDKYHAPYNVIDEDEAPAPMLLANGWNDDLFPADEAVRFYNKVKSNYSDAPISMFLYDQAVHGRGQGKSADNALLTARQNAWMDYYLGGTGPEPESQVEVMTTRCPSTAASDGPYAADSWGEIAPGEIVYIERRRAHHPGCGHRLRRPVQRDLGWPVRNQHGDGYGRQQRAERPVPPRSGSG